MILDFVIELVKIHDVDNVKLSLSEKCLYMKPYFLCLNSNNVSSTYISICINILIRNKFKYFVTHLCRNCINNTSDAYYAR